MAVNNIELPADKRTYKLTVGLHPYNTTAEPNKQYKITISDEHGKKEQLLDHTITKHGSWWLATSIFEISSIQTTKLNIKIFALAGGAQGRIDDLRLVTTTGGTPRGPTTWDMTGDRNRRSYRLKTISSGLRQ